MEKVGRYAFLIGVVISILAGFLSSDWIFAILTLLGLIVGLLNVTSKEVQSFLLAAVSLVIVAGLGSDRITSLPQVGDILGRVYTALLTFVSPAAIIVALKSIFSLAKSA